MVRTFSGVCDRWYADTAVGQRLELKPRGRGDGWEVCNPDMTLPISTAPAVEPAMIDRKALGFSFVSSSVTMEY